MGLNSVPSSERIHIGFFGRRNAGKSSLVNAVTSQALSVVSEVKGTTTDPVYKAMELLPLGPVVIIDTPGIDDTGELGKLRVDKTMEALAKTHVAVLVIDGEAGKTSEEEELISIFKEKNIDYVIAYNKSDLVKREDLEENEILVSAKTGYNIDALKELIAKSVNMEEKKIRIVGDFLSAGDLVVLVIPIDESAPKGRLILPQQQTIRDILESGAMAVAVRDTELKDVFSKFSQKPKLVITDSQAFAKVAKDTPRDILLTSFSILFARYKGDLYRAVMGAGVIDSLKDGDTVLISEGCTHHRQCQDIGTVKIPGWLKEYTGKDINICTTSGTEFPKDLSPYKLIIHCGGCMLNDREMKNRVAYAKSQGVAITNYGIAISYMKGILERSIKLFPEFE